MATYKEWKIDETHSYGSWDLPVMLNRKNPIPIDGTSFFETYENALGYAQENKIAYLGQQLTVINAANTEAKIYKITGLGASAALEEIGTAKLSSSYVKPATYTEPAIGDTLDVAVGKLAKGVSDAVSAGVTSIGGASGAITLRGGQSGSGSVNLAMSGQQLQASIVGLGTAAYQNTNAFDASGSAAALKGNSADNWDSSKTVYGAGNEAKAKVETVTGTTPASKNTTDYIAVSLTTSSSVDANNNKTVTVAATGSVQVQAVQSADDIHKGLAESSDVKNFVNSSIASSTATFRGTFDCTGTYVPLGNAFGTGSAATSYRQDILGQAHLAYRIGTAGVINAGKYICDVTVNTSAKTGQVSIKQVTTSGEVACAACSVNFNNPSSYALVELYDSSSIVAAKVAVSGYIDNSIYYTCFALPSDYVARVENDGYVIAGSEQSQKPGITWIQMWGQDPDMVMENNDYCFFKKRDGLGNVTFERYKVSLSGSNYFPWNYEYTLNNSSFTAAQWDAINSGITSTKREGYDNHLSNSTIHVTSTEKDTWNAKANDNAVVHNTGAESIAGNKTFTNDIQVSAWTNIKTGTENLSTVLGAKEVTVNKVATANFAANKTNDTKYPTCKAVTDYVESVLVWAEF